ncbi:phage tail assembly chaperone [Aureimonas ureilytica]|uniref:phage tail assembly chaperone n=1 Tax=Aureimonas ureilytica TaxID=401562 RepID=UPI003CF9C5E5
MPHLVEAFHAFFDLSPGRIIHQGGEGFISAQEIEAYCALAGIHDAEDRLDLFRMVRAMDAVFLAERESARKQEDDKASPAA